MAKSKDVRVAFIGTGRPWRTEGSTGFGMAYAHAEGYNKIPGVRLVACADLVQANAEAFALKTGCWKTYTDYRLMLKQEKPDMVSICTWPHLHAPMVIDAVQAGVKAIHCEKPMADTWGASRKMAQACAKRKVRLTFNHQRRFGAPYRALRDLHWKGTLGKLVRMECFPPNLYDWGTHWLDMLQMFNRETPASWIIGQVDARAPHIVFGQPCDNQGVFHIKYANGVHGVVITGNDRPGSAALRLVGEQGIGEIHWSEPVLRVSTGGARKAVKVRNELHGNESIDRGVADAVNALRTGGQSELCAANALRATELIFAGYESSRRRARVELPLTINDNPLAAMLKSGQIKTF